MVGLFGPGGEHHLEILVSGSRERPRILEIMFSFLGSGAGPDHCVYVLGSGLREQLRILGVLSFIWPSGRARILEILSLCLGSAGRPENQVRGQGQNVLRKCATGCPFEDFLVNHGGEGVPRPEIDARRVGGNRG